MNSACYRLFELCACLEKERDIYRKFVSLLSQAEDTWSDFSVSSLEDLLEQQRAYLFQLQSIVSERMHIQSQIQVEFGLETEPQFLKQWIIECLERVPLELDEKRFLLSFQEDCEAYASRISQHLKTLHRVQMNINQSIGLLKEVMGITYDQYGHRQPLRSVQSRISCKI